MGVLGTYKNNDYTVVLMDDGTKIRYNDSDSFNPIKPESMDCKITNQCDMGCVMCHEDSAPDGKHGDILNVPFFDTLLPYTEIACLSGDMMVHGENGSIEIQDLKIGDKIYDSDHQLRTIVNIQKQNKPSMLLDGKRGTHVHCSDDHPFISDGKVIEAKNMIGKQIDCLSQILCVNDEEYVIDMSKYIKPPNRNNGVGSRGGKQIDENTVRLHNCTRPIPQNIKITNDLMWLYGLFVAEGSRKGIVLNSNEVDFANRAKDIWKNTFGCDAKFYICEDRHSMSVEFQSQTLVEEWFVKTLHVGEGARNKNLGYLYCINDKELIRHALIGLFDGDGCIRGRKNSNNGVTYSASLKTTSKHLAYDVSYLLAKWFGIYATVYHGMSPKRKIEDRILNASDYYSVEFYGYDSCMKIFYDQINFVKPKQSQHKSKTNTEIKNIVKSFSCDLYDITLDGGSHIFPINGYLLTHNCGGGNPLSHPDLIPFLRQLKERKLIPNMTVNQAHFMRDVDLIKSLVDNKLIYGLGVSLTDANDKFIETIKEFPNAVIHVINGLVSIAQLERLADNGLKILILGYKKFRRGEVFYNAMSQQIHNHQADLYRTLPTILEEGWFDCVSFDNLAIEQLEPKRLMSDEEWSRFHMGEDGQFTLYVDLVEKKFAKSSTSKERYNLEDDIKTMFDEVRC